MPATTVVGKFGVAQPGPLLVGDRPEDVGTRVSTGYARVGKRLLDVAVAAVLLLVVTPLIVLGALLVLMSMGRPIFFRQERVGLDGRPFGVWKLRSMKPCRRGTAPATFAGEERRANHKCEDDPRHTTVGRLIRKWSVDELPQFWNVIKGDMSLVGPRPELPEVVSRYEEWQHLRHAVRPGITGLWQVTVRGHVPLHEATDLDLRYIEDLSFWSDLKILVATPRATLRAKGS